MGRSIRGPTSRWPRVGLDQQPRRLRWEQCCSPLVLSSLAIRSMITGDPRGWGCGTPWGSSAIRRLSLLVRVHGPDGLHLSGLERRSRRPLARRQYDDIFGTAVYPAGRASRVEGIRQGGRRLCRRIEAARWGQEGLRAAQQPGHAVASSHRFVDDSQPELKLPAEHPRTTE
jgi:hypothetical protein